MFKIQFLFPFLSCITSHPRPIPFQAISFRCMMYLHHLISYQMISSLINRFTGGSVEPRFRRTSFGTLEEKMGQESALWNCPAFSGQCWWSHTRTSVYRSLIAIQGVHNMQSCKVVTLPVWLVTEGYGPSIDSSLLITVVLELGSVSLCPGDEPPNHIVHVNNYPFSFSGYRPGWLDTVRSSGGTEGKTLQLTLGRDWAKISHHLTEKTFVR